MRAAVVVLAVVVALNVALLVIAEVLPSPSGPRSSSYATSARGFAALADLLENGGHPIRRVRELPGKAKLDPAGTVIVLDPDLLRRDEARALRDFVRRGGRLVAGGREPDSWVPTLLGWDPGWEGSSRRNWSAEAPVPAVSGVKRVRSAGEGAWENTGRAVAAVGDSAGPSLLLSAGLGSGQVLLLADASPLQNRLLARHHNAALALGLAGTRGRPVQFVEAVHGYGQARGLASLPASWKLALAGLGLAALLFLAARGRRLGPPDLPQRELPPPRRAYVDALAGALDRTGDTTAAAAPVQAASRATLSTRFGLAPDAGVEDVRTAAMRAGLTDAEAAAIVQPAKDDADLVAAGRALVHVTRRTGEY
jgi:hypothetical protein